MEINRVFQDVEEAKKWLIGLFGENESFDVGMTDVHLWNMPVLCVYINGLIDGMTMTALLTDLQPREVPPYERAESEVKQFLSYFPYHAVSSTDEREEWLFAILSGQVGFVTPRGYSFTIDVRTYPGRNPEEPDNEKVIRGSRDGFTENMLQNTALIRRRIRDTSLRFELHKVTTKSKNDTIIAFMKGVASEEHLEYIRKRLKEIKHDGLTMADKSLEEWIFKQRYHPLPFVRYTERPDTAAAHLLEGHIAIIVDTSPSVILVPVTFFHHLQHAEEYRQAPAIGTAVRMMRFAGTFVSLMLIPLWFLLVKHEEHLPKFLDFIGTKEAGEIPLIFQMIAADLGLEFLRMASIHTPTPLSTAMGLIAGILIGQIAIDVGLFTPEVVLYTAVSAILTFAIPSYEMSVAMKAFRLFILLSTALLGPDGFFLALLIIFWYMSSIKPMNVPYLWPLVPFYPVAMKRVLLRSPMTTDALRPYIVDSEERKRV